MQQEQAAVDPTLLYRKLDQHDWDNDNEFQGGLRAILNTAPPDQASRLAVRAKCYYFARKFGTPVDFEGYLNWTNSRRPALNGDHESNAATEHTQAATEEETPQTSGPMGDAPPPASFAEICELIAEGKPIPGIKDIPDTVLEGQATRSQASRRKKPWEKDAAPAPTPSWARAA